MNLRATGFLLWPGNDGLRPYERRRDARKHGRMMRPPTALERQQRVLNEWRKLPASAAVDLMGVAPGFYWSMARWAAHLDAEATVSEALQRAGR